MLHIHPQLAIIHYRVRVVGYYVLRFFYLSLLESTEIILLTVPYMPALAAISCDPVVKAQWEHLVSRHKGEKVGVCAAMHKLLQLAYGILKSRMPFDAKIVLASRRVRGYLAGYVLFNAWYLLAS